ncbi:ATP-binding protein [Veronia nyctiphanis]|uniref:ATP-binding protein n=1 Tax=Veronia nyctiphanis TaxID=1278244 RepID=A0A4V1LSY1_9GAMM|nr:AAA family ATPase [Veronia nyctiphanis]RXJ73278.1 ATP-binding protein [Veronia nyctiphanis]
MLTSLSISNYRSIRDITLPLGPLNVITGANGTGKSNLYKSLKLLADTAKGGVIPSLAIQGGLDSVFWAGPESFSKAMKSGEIPIEGGPRKSPARLKMGFAAEDFGYSISLGLPTPSNSYFSRDPEIKHECIFTGSQARLSAMLVERKANVVRIREGRSWSVCRQHLPMYDSMFDQVADPSAAPEVFHVREKIRGWRFYDQFRTDADAPARQPQQGTRTMALHHDGRDVAAAIRTILEIGDREALDTAIEDAFPGCRLRVSVAEEGLMDLAFEQHGLLRALKASELSDGTLRFVLWVAALLTPRPPGLMVLNEPETSLHPDLLPSLAKLIMYAANQTQVWVISHSNRLIASLNKHPECMGFELEKVLSETTIVGQGMFDRPNWKWPD